MTDAHREIERLRAEVAALRASLGELNGHEPAGCPCPGACSATNLIASEREACAAIADEFAASLREQADMIRDMNATSMHTMKVSMEYALRATTSDDIARAIRSRSGTDE